MSAVFDEDPDDSDDGELDDVMDIDEDAAEGLGGYQERRGRI